jgi:glycine cleavage system regulatory protein
MSMHERMESMADLYAAGGLSADERREADQHAAGCPSCAALLRDAKEFAAWARGAIAPDAPPADLEDRLVARFRASGQSKKRRFLVGKRILKVSGSIAAAVALVFLGNAFSDHGPTSLKTLASAEADFRANDRDWHHVNKFWTTDSAGREERGAIAGKEREGLRDGKPPAGDEFAYFFGKDLGIVERDKANQQRGLQEGLDKLAQDREGGARFGGLPGGMAKALQDQAEADNLEVTKLNRSLNRLTETESAGEALKSIAEEAKAGDEQAQQPLQKIIRTADVSLEVESYEATYAKLTELIAAEKGNISAASTQKMANGKIQATLTIRIAPERYEAVIGRFKEFGTILNQTLGSEDVTKAYIDLETRLKSKEILAERLRKLLAEAKGNVKELMEVEVQLGATNEAIEQIKGEIKYYDNLVGMSTITLRLFEKDLGQPFEIVETLKSNIAVTARDPNDVYVKAQKEITDAGGRVIASNMSRQNDGTSVGTVRGRVDSEKFPALREALKKLGVVTNDTVSQEKIARGGKQGMPKADAPIRKEQAVVDFTISSPPLFVTKRSQILIETAQVESAYQNARRVVEAAGGKIVDGSLTGRADGMSAVLRAQVDAEKFADLLTSLKAAGEVKNANVNHTLPAVGPEGTMPLLRERAEIELALVSPPKLIGEQHGVLKTIRDTFANSWAGLLWSIEKLFVGISLAGPWIVVLAVAWILWRRARRKKAATPAA